MQDKCPIFACKVLCTITLGHKSMSILLPGISETKPKHYFTLIDDSSSLKRSDYRKVNLLGRLQMRIQGPGTNEFKQSYWSEDLNWSQGL
jgi:hypothetical protein